MVLSRYLIWTTSLTSTGTIPDYEKLETIDELNNDLTIMKRKVELEKVRLDIEFEAYFERQ